MKKPHSHFCILEISFKIGRYEYKLYVLYWAYYLICALFIAIICLELFKHFSNLPEKKSSESFEEKTHDFSDIEKLHDLLTKGIITQEEFDAKKKEILDL